MTLDKDKTNKRVTFEFQIELESEMFVFEEGGKHGGPREKIQSMEENNNKLNPHITPSPGIEPRPHRCEASAHTTAPSLLPLMMQFSKYLIHTLHVYAS